MVLKSRRVGISKQWVKYAAIAVTDDGVMYYMEIVIHDRGPQAYIRGYWLR